MSEYTETCERIWGCVPVDRAWAIGTKIYQSNKHIGKYRITYANGMIQEKDLISHEEFLRVIKPEVIGFPENPIGRTRTLGGERRKDYDAKKEFVRRVYGESHDWFTDGSPMWEAFKKPFWEGFKQVLKHYGGESRIEIKRI